MNSSKPVGTVQTLFLTLRPPRTFAYNFIGHQAYYLVFLEKMAQALELTIVGEARHAYPKMGETIVMFLAESHAILETYPEHGLVELEIASCKRFSYLRAVGQAERWGFRVLGGSCLYKSEDHSWAP